MYLSKFSGYVVRWKYCVKLTGVKTLKGKQSRYEDVGRDKVAYFFWQGKDSTLNEKGTAALMTVELDSDKGPQVGCQPVKRWMLAKAKQSTPCWQILSFACSNLAYSTKTLHELSKIFVEHVPHVARIQFRTLSLIAIRLVQRTQLRPLVVNKRMLVLEKLV